MRRFGQQIGNVINNVANNIAERRAERWERNHPCNPSPCAQSGCGASEYNRYDAKEVAAKLRGGAKSGVSSSNVVRSVEAVTTVNQDGSVTARIPVTHGVGQAVMVSTSGGGRAYGPAAFPWPAQGEATDRGARFDLGRVVEKDGQNLLLVKIKPTEDTASIVVAGVKVEINAKAEREKAAKIAPANSAPTVNVSPSATAPASPAVSSQPTYPASTKGATSTPPTTVVPVTDMPAQVAPTTERVAPRHACPTVVKPNPRLQPSPWETANAIDDRLVPSRSVTSKLTVTQELPASLPRLSSDPLTPVESSNTRPPAQTAETAGPLRPGVKTPSPGSTSSTAVLLTREEVLAGVNKRAEAISKSGSGNGLILGDSNSSYSNGSASNRSGSLVQTTQADPSIHPNRVFVNRGTSQRPFPSDFPPTRGNSRLSSETRPTVATDIVPEAARTSTIRLTDGQALVELQQNFEQELARVVEPQSASSGPNTAGQSEPGSTNVQKGAQNKNTINSVADTLTQTSNETTKAVQYQNTEKANSANQPATDVNSKSSSTVPTQQAKLRSAYDLWRTQLPGSEWARKHPLQAITVKLAAAEAVLGPLRADFEPEAQHNPIPHLITLFNNDLKTKFSFSTQEGGLVASIAAESFRGVGDVTIGAAAFGGVEALARNAAATRVGAQLGLARVIQVAGPALTVVGPAAHGYFTFSNGQFMHMNDLQLGANVATPVVTGAILGAPMGPIGSAFGAGAGAVGDAAGVIRGYYKLEQDIENDYWRREVRDALQNFRDGWILPEGKKVNNRRARALEELHPQHQEALRIEAQKDTLYKVYTVLTPTERAGLGFKELPPNRSDVDPNVRDHNWNRVVELSEGKDWLGYRHLSYVKDQQHAKRFETLYVHSLKEIKEAYDLAHRVEYRLDSNGTVIVNDQKDGYCKKFVETADPTLTDLQLFSRLQAAFPDLDSLLRNQRSKEDLINRLERHGEANFGKDRFRKILDINFEADEQTSIPPVLEASPPLTETLPVFTPRPTGNPEYTPVRENLDQAIRKVQEYEINHGTAHTWDFTDALTKAQQLAVQLETQDYSAEARNKLVQTIRQSLDEYPRDVGPDASNMSLLEEACGLINSTRLPPEKVSN